MVGTLHGTPVRINQEGMRGDPLQSGSGHRILALGDSTTFGWRVVQTESYPARLQGQLDDSYGDGVYEVLNAGAPGYTSYQGLRVLEDRIRLKPRTVIVGFGFNDKRRARDVEEQLSHAPLPFLVQWLDDSLLLHSVAYGAARQWGGFVRRAGDAVSSGPRVRSGVPFRPASGARHSP